MTKKGSLIIMSIILLTILTGCGINQKELTGEILMSHNINIYSQEDDDEIVIYIPSTQEFRKIVPGLYFDLTGMEFNEDKTKIIGIKPSEEFERKSYVFEYDINEKKFVKIIDESKKIKSNTGFTYLKYVPNSTNVSFIADEKLYVFDRVTNSYNVLLDNVSKQYDWDETGKKIVYDSNYDEIYLFDLINKESKQILEGRFPVFSNDSQLIVYQSEDHILTVYNVNTKEEWRSLFLQGSEEYIFSPDDKYILLATQYTDITNNPHFEMYVLDYKTGEKIKLFKGEGGIPSFDWK